MQSLPELPPEDKKGQEELASLTELKKKFESKIVLLQGRLAKIAEIETKVKILKTKIQEISTEIGVLLDSIGVTEKNVFTVSLMKTESRLSSKKKRRELLIS